MLLQERYKDDPWKLLVCCILLNQTHRRQVDRVIDKGFFDTYSTPRALAMSYPAAVSEHIRELGFGSRRGRTLVNMSRRWLECCDDILFDAKDRRVWPSKEQVGALPGVGPYALDSYRIFVLDEIPDDVNDKELRRFLDARRTATA